jgi:hypothetical protein
MAKFKRTVIGSIVKSKDPGKGDYLKVSGSHVLTDGQFLNLESKASQLASLEAAIAAGKISGDNANGAKERINKIPDFVRFQVVAVSKED